MKKMKKILALTLALLMMFTLVACGEKINDTQGEEGTVEITLATYPIGKYNDQATLDSLIADFNAVYPNIKVNTILLDYTNGDDQVNTMIEGGQAPDVIMEGPERLIANWGAKGLMVDLKDLVPAGTYESVLTSCTNAEGAVYELPVCMTAHCMAINRDLFEAAGALQYIDEETRTWTTENFVKAVEALVAYGQENVAIVYCGGQGGDQGTRALVTNLYGGTYANAEHTEYTVSSPENVQALELLKSTPGISFDPAAVASDEINMFCNGTLAMAFCWNQTQETNNADKIAFDVLPMAFPTNEGDPVLQGGIWGFGMFNTGNEAKMEAAKTFIKFMTEDDAQYIKTVEASSFFATRDLEGVYESNDLMNEYSIFAPYMGDYYQITLGWTEARTAWWNALQAINNGTDVATALEDFQATANAAAAAAAG